MTIVVVDGQGGGIGRALIEKLKNVVRPIDQIIAVGTNSFATGAMLKCGDVAGATGENAVVYNASRADLIIGSIGIVAANSMMGELSPAMANAISQSEAVKILLPVNKCNLRVAGVSGDSVQQRIEDAIGLVREYIKE